MDGHFWPIWPPYATLGCAHHLTDTYTLPPWGFDKNGQGLGPIAPYFGEMWKFEISFLANFSLLLVETMNPCDGFFSTSQQHGCSTMDSEIWNEIAWLEFEINWVEFRKNACDRRTCVNNLPTVVNWKRNGRERTRDLLSRKSNRQTRSLHFTCTRYFFVTYAHFPPSKFWGKRAKHAGFTAANPSNAAAASEW